MAGTPGGTGVYWNGADGNTYIKQAGQQGVVNFGTPAALAANNKTSGFNTLRGLTQINDPNAPAGQAPTNPNNTSGNGGGSAPAFQDKSNDLAVQNAGLAANDSQTQGSVDKINASLASILGGYDTETTANKTNYTTQSNANQNQFQTGKQTALVNAANGRQGLLGTLASIGALSGDGLALANNAVQHGANEDLSGASGTFATNQTGLDTALGTYTAADAARRKNANTAASNDVQNAQNSGATSKQNFLTAIANDYAAQGDKANAAKYSGMAAALYPTIAATNVPSQSLSAETAAYTPSSLANYLSRGNTIVNTSAPTQSGGLSIPGLTASTKKQTSAVAA